MAPQALAGTTVAGQQHIFTEMHFLNSSCAPCGQASPSPSAEPAHGQAPRFLFQFAASFTRRTEAPRCCHFCSPPLSGEAAGPTLSPACGGSGVGSVILSPPPPKAAFSTYSLRNPHFLIFMDVKSKEILWRGPSVLSRGSEPEQGRPAARRGRKEAQPPLFAFVLLPPAPWWRGDVAFTSDSWGPGCPATR